MTGHALSVHIQFVTSRTCAPLSTAAAMLVSSRDWRMPVSRENAQLRALDTFSERQIGTSRPG
jgi:hypothetical protein